MRLALVSDIHGNYSGLKTVFAHLKHCGSFDTLYVLGDIRGGIGTEGVIDLLVENYARLIRGNAEELLFDIENLINKTTDPSIVRQKAEWCLANLSDAHLNLLRSLPTQETVEIAPNRKVFLCHAAPNDVWKHSCEPTTPTAMLRETYGSLDAEVIVYGHYHGHHVISLDGKLLINVAGVGIGNGLSAVTLLEYDNRWIVQQFQVPSR